MRLTNEQRKFAEENHNLIYKFLYRKNLNPEEWYGVVAIGYVKAVATFDPEKAEFSTYAYRCMNNSVGMEYRKQKAPCISLNEAFQNEDGGTCELQDFIPDSFDYAVDIDPAIDLNSMFNGLSDREQKILLMKAIGYSDAEIGTCFGISRAYASMISSRTRGKLKYNS